MTFQYDSAAACRAQFRQFRNRLELSDCQLMRNLEAAGQELGLHSRASASPAIRDYIWRKQCAIVQHERQRAPWRPIVNYGRELPLSMLRGA